MPPKKSESSADIARHVISQLENSDAFKLIVKSAVREAVADLAVRLEEQEARVLELEVQVKAQASEIEQLKKAKESTMMLLEYSIPSLTLWISTRGGE